MILQRPRIIVEDAGFEPGTSAPEVWRTIPLSHHISESNFALYNLTRKFRAYFLSLAKLIIRHLAK